MLFKVRRIEINYLENKIIRYIAGLFFIRHLFWRNQSLIKGPGVFPFILSRIRGLNQRTHLSVLSENLEFEKKCEKKYFWSALNWTRNEKPQQFRTKAAGKLCGRLGLA